MQDTLTYDRIKQLEEILRRSLLKMTAQIDFILLDLNETPIPQDIAFKYPKGVTFIRRKHKFIAKGKHRRGYIKVKTYLAVDKGIEYRHDDMYDAFKYAMQPVVGMDLAEGPDHSSFGYYPVKIEHPKAIVSIS